MNYSRYFTPLLACSLLLFSHTSFSDGVGLSIGVHGVAIDYQKSLSEKLSARLMLSDMPLNLNANAEGIDYEVEYDRTNLGFLLDYHPMAGTFHLTGGIYTLDHNINLTAAAANGSYHVGDNTYTSNDLKLKAQVAFAKAAPYLGLGWGNTIAGTGFSGNLDLGLMYVGTPAVSYTSSGTVTSGGVTANVDSNPTFQQDLEKERTDIQDKLSKFNLMPIIQFGLTYKF